MEVNSMAQAVQKVIEGYPVGFRFHGNELKNDVCRIYPKSENMYVDTIQRAMRRHCKFMYRTVDQNKSLYEKV